MYVRTRVSRESAESQLLVAHTRLQSVHWPPSSSSGDHVQPLLSVTTQFYDGWRSETHNSNGMTRSFLRKYALYHMFERRGWQEMRRERIRNDKKQHDTNRGCSGSSGNTLVSKCVKEIINEDVFSWLIMLQQGKKNKKKKYPDKQERLSVFDWQLIFFTLNPVLHYITTNFADCQLTSYEIMSTDLLNWIVLRHLSVDSRGCVLNLNSICVCIGLPRYDRWKINNINLV